MFIYLFFLALLLALGYLQYYLYEKLITKIQEQSVLNLTRIKDLKNEINEIKGDVELDCPNKKEK